MQSYYPMEALTKDNEFYQFDVTDVPVNINKNEFVLAARENTPILKQGLIRRGCDIPGIFEGDIIKSDGKDYVFCYQRGFMLSSRKREKKLLWELDSYEIIGNIFTQEWPFQVDCAKSVYYSLEGKLIYPQGFIGYVDNKIIVKENSYKIDPTMLQQYAWFSYEGRKVFYGDLIKGYPVEMYYGRPVIKYDNIIYDVIYKTNIERKVQQ